MDKRCSICLNVGGSCRWSNHRLFSFSVTMTQAFEDHVVVPCYFRERLNDFAASFLVMNSGGFKFDVYIHRNNVTTVLCGAYWRSFAKVYKLEDGDVVLFSTNAFGCMFDVTVSDENKVQKSMSYIPTIHEMNDWKRHKLHGTIFTDMASLSEGDVGKIAQSLSTREFTEDYQDHFYIAHKMTAADIASGCLVIPSYVTFWLELPTHGLVIFHFRDFAISMTGSYISGKSMKTVINGVWKDLHRYFGINAGSTVLIKIGKEEPCIMLDIEIIKARGIEEADVYAF